MGGLCDECAGQCCWYVLPLPLFLFLLVWIVWDADLCDVGGVGSHANAMAIL